MFWFLVLEVCGVLALSPGIEPTPPALESKGLTLDCQECPNGEHP